ncbi:MAG: hypothetical protein ACI4U9_03260 [Clostridia bacterium]
MSYKFEDNRSLYQQLEDLKEAKKILYSAIHNNFYNDSIRQGLYEKVMKVNKKMDYIRYLIKKEKKEQAKNEKGTKI